MAPKRHPGCQDKCDEYKKAKARYEADKARQNKATMVDRYTYDKSLDVKDGYVKYIKRRPKNRRVK